MTRVDDFDSHGTLQFYILSIVNGSHPAVPEHAFDAKICELATYHSILVHGRTLCVESLVSLLEAFVCLLVSV